MEQQLEIVSRVSGRFREEARGTVAPPSMTPQEMQAFLYQWNRVIHNSWLFCVLSHQFLQMLNS